MAWLGPGEQPAESRSIESSSRDSWLAVPLKEELDFFFPLQFCFSLSGCQAAGFAVLLQTMAMTRLIFWEFGSGCKPWVGVGAAGFLDSFGVLRMSLARRDHQIIMEWSRV